MDPLELMFKAVAKVMVVDVESFMRTRTPFRGPVELLLVKVRPALKWHPEMLWVKLESFGSYVKMTADVKVKPSQFAGGVAWAHVV